MKCSNTGELLLCSRCKLVGARRKEFSRPRGLHHLPEPPYLTGIVKRSDSD